MSIVTSSQAQWIPCKARDGEVLAAWPVQGFRADLACRLPGQMQLVVEVNSEQRRWAEASSYTVSLSDHLDENRR